MFRSVSLLSIIFLTTLACGYGRRLPRSADALAAANPNIGSIPKPDSSSLIARVDVEKYLQNKRAMQFQIKCVVYSGYCDSVGKEIKKYILLGLTGKCSDCSARLTEKILKIANHIQENYPKAWYDAIYRYLVLPNVGSSTTTISPVQKEEREIVKPVAEVKEEVPEDETVETTTLQE